MTPIRVHSDPPRHVAATATIWRLGAALALVLTSAVPVHDAHATNAFASWTANGVPVATDPGNAAVGVPIVDGLGGTYVAWLNTPIGATGYEVRIQHLMRNGERDPRWPASGVLATTTPGTFDVQSDRASGLYVMSGDGVTTMRVTRIREDGSFAPGWPQGGIASQISGAVAWAVGGDGGIWEFGIRLEQQQHCVPGEPCPSYYIVASTRIDPNGTLVPGWEPPGRTLYSSPFVFGYWIIARGFSGGVALLVQWEDPFVGNQYVTEFVHLRPDGTSARARVGVPSHYTTTFWDLDDQGVGLVTLGDFVVSGLQKFAPGPLWANQGSSFLINRKWLNMLSLRGFLTAWPALAG